MSRVINFEINIPDFVEDVLNRLTEAGYEAYIVGGCVRDALMGRTPGDWDVCTSALPEETLAVFAGEKTIETGIKHGTVTVMSQGQPVEITTYRIDGEYEDGRRPKEVEFTRCLEEDLARRDFTINAMAYHPKTGIVDLYGGRDDLKVGLIRCVGEPSRRFKEDGLRIMRGLRFASVLDFSIEPKTDQAMRQLKDNLNQVSKERINVELSKLLLGSKADAILAVFIEILEVAAPGIEIPKRSLQCLPANLPIRLAAVFPKDTGKWLRELKYDGNTIRLARVLSRLDGTPALTEPKLEMLKFLHRYGEKTTILHYARAGEKELEALVQLLKEEPCYEYRHLAINGDDLIEAGIDRGPKLGDALDRLLNLVIEGEVENEKEALLAALKEEQ